eukprot:1663836-Amphidinium_carterae.1
MPELYQRGHPQWHFPHDHMVKLALAEQPFDSSKLAAGVCVEGPFRRSTSVQLQRMAAALYGLNDGRHLVFGVPSVELASETCDEAKDDFEFAFGDRLAAFRCIPDDAHAKRKLFSRSAMVA